MKKEPFLLADKSLGSFLVTQGLQLAIFFLLMAILFPTIWARQVASGPLVILSVFVGLHLLASFFEFFFHRYVLHLAFLKPFASFAKKHGRHHGLTPVKMVQDGELHRVMNAFPIVEDSQREHSVFPWYALMGFAVTFTPVILILQLLFPALPIIIGGYLAVFVSYVGYEVIHAFEHRSYTFWWKPRIEGPFSGGLWKSAYSFHLTHHANNLCNEAIAGFFGLPVADWVLGTYKKAPQLFTDGVMIEAEDFKAPRPSWVIRKIDALLGVA